MKKIAYLVIWLCCSCYSSLAQVGIGTTSPDPSSILHVESIDKGLLIPRLSAVQITDIANPANGLIVYSTTTNRFVYNTGTTAMPIWDALVPSSVSDTYIGKFTISSTGIQTISELPFKPTSIKFSAHANVESYNVNADNGIGNNNNTFQNTFGSMEGYATNYGGSIQQQAIFVGGSGSSINDISRYASSSRIIGIRYSNNNGNNLGLTAASITSFNSNGFTINVTNHTEDIVVIYEAHR
mgnify:CR=1 FL=1